MIDSQRVKGRAASRVETGHFRRGVIFAVVVLILAWGWYASAMFEAQSEQPKAVFAGTTMAGFAEVFGGVPLVTLHVACAIMLIRSGWLSYGRRGIGWGLLALALASLFGIIVMQLLAGGELFEYGIHNEPDFVP